MREEVRLHRDLLQRDHQRPVGEILEREAGVEVAGVVEPSARLGVAARVVDVDLRDLRFTDDAHRGMRRDRLAVLGSIVTRQWQCGVRSARYAGRAMDRPHLCVRVGRASRRVEGGVFDVVAHAWTNSSPIGSTSMSAPQ